MSDAKGDENPRDRFKHAPDNSQTALLLVDVINDLDFPGGEKAIATGFAHGRGALCTQIES